jgi:S-methylmethionine-dependent homocysteine/selenocysteine methylase
MALETLEILIEADRSGLTSQLKRAGSDIQNFIQQMNRQEVNWTSILSKSVTPAMIAAIASTFAIAVTQALQFQSAMQQASLGAATSLTNNSAQMSGAVYAMSNKTGQSATDIAGALGTVEQVFKDTATAQAMLNVVSQEAFIRHQNVADVAKELVPLFEQWGITSAPAASDAMAILNDSVKAGSISFSDLVTGLTDSGAALRKYTDLGKAAASFEVFSTTPGQDSSSALQAMAGDAKLLEEPLSQASLLMGNVVRDLKSGDLSQGFIDMINHVKDAGVAANTMYGQLYDPATIDKFSQDTTAALQKMQTEVNALIANHKTLGEQVVENTTDTDKLKISYETFKNAVTGQFGGASLKILEDTFNGIAGAIEGANLLAADFQGTLGLIGTSDFWKSLGENLAQTGADIGAIATLGLSKIIGGAIGTDITNLALQNKNGVSPNTTPATLNGLNDNSPATAGGVVANFTLKNNITVLPGQANQASSTNYSQVVR